MMDEGLEIIRRPWEGETLDFEGKHYQPVRPASDAASATSAPAVVGRRLAPAAAAAARRQPGPTATSVPPTWPSRRARSRKNGNGTGRPDADAPLAGTPGSSRAAHRNAPLTPWRPTRSTRSRSPLGNQWLKDAGRALFPAITGPGRPAPPGDPQCRDAGRGGRRHHRRAYQEATRIERHHSWMVPPGYPVDGMNEHLALFAEEAMPHFRAR
ncbi:MAG: hypothetical protein IPN13_07990 [Bacteroidetes bacterium]|nr:hypothetical protein [Bacteroidota bacterium]